jgi:hypothetical protein
MEQLQEYLTGQFHSEKQEVAQVEQLITEVIKTLLSVFDQQHGWPYEISQSGGVAQTRKVSQSTTAMVLVSLAKLLPWSQRSALGVNPLPFAPKMNESLAKQLREKIQKGKSILVQDVGKGPTPVLLSDTYGNDDPITLSFIAQLCDADGSGGTEWGKVRKLCEGRVVELCNVVDLVKPGELWRPPAADHRPILNAVIPLRVVQALKSLRLPGQELTHYRRYFEVTLHEHLSFSSIPDSRFDPGELTFALEGLLLSHPDAVDVSLFQRTLDVLAQAQKVNAFWRPNKPFIATAKGLSLFPVSVEVANSLLRSCEIYDRDKIYETVSSLAIGLFRRYWQWLRARTIRLRVNDIDYVGWGSEHVNDATLIHVWETSQVLEFLIAYRRMLDSYVGRQTLILSRFNLKPVSLPAQPPDWADIISVYEPVTCLGEDYQVYRRIGVDFVAGWIRQDRVNYSMLLYGPPGTGKTTLAENIAKALRYRIINISVSDFLAEGSAAIEARAKAIFDVLNSQRSCVVLLDEIDQLVLDRDSARYSEQQDVFQFMTPGMLTKLNDLRATERVIFIIATNYANRIDSAIKRPGRIDRQYLVLPPDRGARRRILRDILCKTPVDCAINPAKLATASWQKLETASLYLGFKDIEGAIEGLLHASSNVEELVSALEHRSRPASLSNYEARFPKAGASAADDRPPEEEFLCVLALGLEHPDQEAAIWDEPALNSAARWFGRNGVGNIEATVEKIIHGMTNTIRDKVVEVLLERYNS